MTSTVRTGAALPDLGMREVAGSGGGRSWSRRGWAAAAVAATSVALLSALHGSGGLFRPEGLGLVADFAGAAADPRTDAEFLSLTLTATGTTLAYAVLGTALSLVLGVAGGVLGSQVWWASRTAGTGRRRALAGWACTRVALVVPRGIHEVIWGLLLLSVLGIDPTVAVLAIAIPFGAVTAKVFSEILDETPREAYTALIGAGVGRRAAVLYGLVPRAAGDLLSYSFYRFECAVRSAAVLGLLGVGGLGYELQLSFQALRYEEIWTLLYALVALGALADFWSWLVRRRRSSGAAGPRRDPVLLGSAVLVGALVPLSAWWIGLSGAPLWSTRTWDLAGHLASAAWPPTLGPSGWSGLLEQAGTTLAMSVLAIAFAFTCGALLAFPAADLSHLNDRPRHRIPRVLRVVTTRAALLLLRSIPPPLWALLLLFVLYPGVLPGALALGIYTAGVLGRLMAEATENLDTRPVRALRASGAPTPQVVCYALVPAAAPRFVAYGLYRWEVIIRETVIVGVVGAGGLGLTLHHQLAAFDYSGTLTTVLTLIALTLVVDLTSSAIRRNVR